MVKKIICLTLCAVLLFGALSVFASAQEDVTWYKIRVDAGQGTVIEKAVMKEEELYIPADHFARYTRWYYDAETGFFLVKGQEVNKAFKKILVLPSEKKLIVNDKTVNLSDCFVVEGELYLPFCQMLPILNAQVVTAESGLGRVILVANGELSMAELLYDFDVNDYSYDLAEEFYDNELLLLGYTIPSYLFDSVTNIRVERLDPFFDSGDYVDYKEIFQDYLKDDTLYRRAYGEVDEARVILDVLGGYHEETEKLYDFFDWVKDLQDHDIKVPETVLADMFRSGDGSIADPFKNEWIGVITGAHNDDSGLSAAEIIEALDYVYTYVNHVEDNHKMLDAVYGSASGSGSKDAQYRAADAVYDLYDGKVLKGMTDYILKKEVEDFLEEYAAGKTFLLYALTAKVSGEIMELAMPGDTEDVSRLTLHAGVASTAKLKAGSYSLETQEGAGKYRQALLLSLIASRKCYEIMAETAEGYGHNAAGYRAKITKIEHMIMGLYRVAENEPFDTYEHFEAFARENRTLLKQAGIFDQPEELEPGDMAEIEDGVYFDYLRAHPEYRYYALLDVNQDGVKELLATDTLGNNPDRYDDLLVCKNGQFELEARIWNKYAPMTYDSVNRWLCSQDGGTGMGMNMYYLDQELNVKQTSFYWSNVDDSLYIDGILVDDEILQDAYDELADKWNAGDHREVVFVPVP